MKYAGHTAVVDIDGVYLAGSQPARQTTLLRAWMLLHKEELEADWHIAMQGGDVFRIEPLR